MMMMVVVVGNSSVAMPQYIYIYIYIIKRNLLYIFLFTLRPSPRGSLLLHGVDAIVSASLIASPPTGEGTRSKVKQGSPAMSVVAAVGVLGGRFPLAVAALFSAICTEARLADCRGVDAREARREMLLHGARESNHRGGREKQRNHSSVLL